MFVSMSIGVPVLLSQVSTPNYYSFPNDNILFSKLSDKFYLMVGIEPTTSGVSYLRSDQTELH